MPPKEQQSSTTERIRTALMLVSLSLGIIMGVLGMAQAWVILPYRLGEAEKRIELLQIGRNQDHEILIRIEEQTAEIRRQIVKP